jgi:hypothetical protein
MILKSELEAKHELPCSSGERNKTMMQNYGGEML